MSIHLQFERTPRVLPYTRKNMIKACEEKDTFLLKHGGIISIATTLDVWADDDSIKLSYYLQSYRSVETYSQRKGEAANRLEIKFHFDKRTAYAVNSPVRKIKMFELDERQKAIADKLINTKKFDNITQPYEKAGDRYEWAALFYPEEVYQLFSEKLGFTVAGKWNDLSWALRLSHLPLEKHEIVKRWFHLLYEKAAWKNRDIMSPFEEPRSRMVESRTMRYFKKMIAKKTQFDASIRMKLMALAAEEFDLKIDKKYANSYFKNPGLIHAHDTIVKYFNDINIARYVIENASPDKFRMNLDRESYIRVWKSETTMARRVIENPDYFDDTTRSILLIWRAGVEFRTKGPLTRLHDEASREYSRIMHADRPIHPPFEDSVETTDIGEFIFHYPKTTHELIDIGSRFRNCVGSYGNEAASGYCVIFVVLKNDNLEACCEVRNGKLRQALGYGNSPLSWSLRNLITEYFNEREWPSQPVERQTLGLVADWDEVL